MNRGNPTWKKLADDYLTQVEQALSSVNHPRCCEIIQDVRAHLDQRFAELTPDQQTWENFQAIITDMGPTSDYAELLQSTPMPTGKRRGLSLKLIVVLLLVLIVVIVGATIWSQKSSPVTCAQSSPPPKNTGINDKIAQLDLQAATLDDIIDIFGEPQKYVWHRQVFTRRNLPSRYIAVYPNDFRVFIYDNRISELRFQSPKAGYIYRDKLWVGSSLVDVLKVLGEPSETIVGGPIGFADGILYKDVNGDKGRCYYAREDQDIRMFFLGYRINALYHTAPESTEPAPSQATDITEEEELSQASRSVEQSVSQAAEQAATQVALAWLELIDTGAYGASYDQAAPIFQKAVTKSQWSTALDQTRAPLGKLIARQLKSSTYTTSVPGAPDGQYVIIQYTTSFENKRSATETITPTLGKDNQWRVSGYYIK